jgi:hypothetical protein
MGGHLLKEPADRYARGRWGRIAGLGVLLVDALMLASVALAVLASALIILDRA